MGLLLWNRGSIFIVHSKVDVVLSMTTLISFVDSFYLDICDVMVIYSLHSQLDCVLAIVKVKFVKVD
jgi:hypothetical protein